MCLQARLRSLPASLSKLTGLRHLDMGRNDLGADDKGCLPQGPWSSLQVREGSCTGQ